MGGRTYARAPKFKYTNTRWPFRAGDTISGFALFEGTPEQPRALIDGYQLTHDIWWMFYVDADVPHSRITTGMAYSLEIGHAADEQAGATQPLALTAATAARSVALGLLGLLGVGALLGGLLGIAARVAPTARGQLL